MLMCFLAAFIGYNLFAWEIATTLAFLPFLLILPVAY